MTVEELKERRRELRARKREALALKETGAADNFTLFFIDEELLDVNAQLRRLTGGKRVGKRTASIDGNRFAVDRALYMQWIEAQGDDEEICREGDVLRKVLCNAGSILTEKQLLYLEHWSRGEPMERIARESGVAKSTVSRTIRRGKAKLQAAAEREIFVRRMEGDVLDLRRETVAKTMLDALTEKQAMYLYLYYGEWMSLREIAELLGLASHQSVMRSVHNALGTLAEKLPLPEGTIVDFRGLGELLYGVYQQMEPEEFLPPRTRETLKKLDHAPRRTAKRRNYIPLADLPRIAVQSGRGAESVWLPGMEHGRAEPGLLRRLLLERKRGQMGSAALLRYWLAQIFGRLKRELCG